MRFCTGGCKDAQEGRKNSAEHTNSTLRFWMQCATMNRKLNIKQQVPFIVCRAAEPSGALERVKGKRVQIPHDLVTVIRESASGCFAPATGALLWEGDDGRRSFSQETCPLLVRGCKPQITRNWLYQKALKQQRSFCHAIRRTEGPLLSSLFPVPFVWFKPQFIQQERTRQ